MIDDGLKSISCELKVDNWHKGFSYAFILPPKLANSGSQVGDADNRAEVSGDSTENDVVRRKRQWGVKCTLEKGRGWIPGKCPSWRWENVAKGMGFGNDVRVGQLEPGYLLALQTCQATVLEVWLDVGASSTGNVRHEWDQFGKPCFPLPEGIMHL